MQHRRKAAHWWGVVVAVAAAACGSVDPDNGDDDDDDDAMAFDGGGSNAAPSVSDVAIAPDPAVAGDTLTCVYTFEDADGDADASTIAWIINDVEAGVGPTLDSGFMRGDLVRCDVTPFDGTDEGTPASASTEIANAPPVIDAVAVDPDPPRVGDTLTCPFTATDADGDELSHTVTWEINGGAVGIGDTLDSGFARGDEVACTVVVADASAQSDPATATAVVANGLPSVATVTVTPAAPKATDTLTCAWSGFSDPDGDADASTVAWTVNGAPAGTATTLAGVFASGDTVVCAVTPFDGTDAGAVTTGTVVIDNAPPSIESAFIAPNPPMVTDTVTCGWTGFSDPDGDPDLSTAAWTINGSPAGVGTTLTAAFAKGDDIECIVTPNDGKVDGAPVSASTTATNAPPSVSSVAISPGTATVLDALACSYVFADPDGDADGSTIAWRVNGISAGTGPTLAAGTAQRGDTVECTVTPHDGTTAGAPSADSIVLVNAPPSVVAVALLPSAVFTDTVVSASASTTDPDGDTVTLSYVWTVDGTPVGGSTPSLNGAFFFDKDQTVEVTVTPNDGFGPGTSMSDSVVVQNSPPGAPSISVTPSDPAVGATVDCNVVVGASDPDGDSISYFYAWDEDSTARGSSASVVAVAAGLWTCNAVPFDGTDLGNGADASTTVWTEVGGTIATDTTWGIDASPIRQVADVHVDPGQTLTIDPGVVLDGTIYKVILIGTLWAAGTPGSMIEMTDVRVVGDADFGDNFFAHIEYVHFVGGSFLGPPSGYGSFAVYDSVFESVGGYTYAWYPTSDVFVERNIFIDSGHFSVGLNDVEFWVLDNVFYDWPTSSPSAVENWASYGTAGLYVHGNSFLSTDRTAVSLPPGYTSSAMNATNNWWNTTDTAVIESMIFDINDDGSCASAIPYAPFLTGPSANSPDPTPWLP